MGHGGRVHAAALPGAAAADEDAVTSDSDSDAAPGGADGEGVWEQAFCIVCNCLIEPDADADAADADARAPDADDGAWEAAAVAKVPIHARAHARAHAARRTPRAAPSGPPRAPLFCSDECRRADEARAEHLSELVHYMAPPTDGARRTSQPAYVPRSASFGATHPLSQSLSAAGAPPAASSLRAASLRAAPARAAPARAAADAPAFDAVRRPRAPMASPAMSNLSRARQAQPHAAASPGTSPPGTSSPGRAAASPGTSPRTRLGASPLGLLPAGLRHRAEPSVSVVTDARAGAGAATPAAEALRRAQDAHGAEPHSLTHVVSTLLQRDVPASPPAATSARERHDEPEPVAIRGARPREGSGSDTSSTASGRRTLTERRRAARGRDAHVLPPLLCPAPASPLSRSFGAAPAALSTTPGRTRSPLGAWGAALTPNVGDAGLLSRSVGHAYGGAHVAPAVAPGTSPRRAGLGWSALAPRHAASPARAARPASVAGTTWRYASRDGDLKMYPILQLPGTDIHDLYSEYWSAPDAAPADGAPVRAPRPDELLARRRASPKRAAPETRRKSLFHFDA
ncbi:hypothetical protein MBRA1_003706 [Malassezia brasiliensis]|uniref:Uncharacterized protein n=1 Tax=Malassezia brasiliensis TaxID=1821822 RepID=A0AAF0DX66_9BASI|nr:hypothetical protein MBRA1_003706 [Malassezia brasiliensis]